MRKYGYNRPCATLYTKRRTVRKKKPSFFFKFFLYAFLLVGLTGCCFVGVRYAYRIVKDAQITDWHVKTVSVLGEDAEIEKEIFTRTTPLQGKVFSFAQAQQLQQELEKQYPMLRKVEVSRGLLSGKLKISVELRKPVAQFISVDDTYRYIDQDSVVFAYARQLQDVPSISLVGDVPDQLPVSFANLIQETLKLKKSLLFDELEFDLQQHTLRMHLPDQSVILFGSLQQLKQKAQRAAQIMDIARKKYHHPVIINFEFFEQGKVFLTLSAH